MLFTQFLPENWSSLNLIILGRICAARCVQQRHDFLLTSSVFTQPTLIICEQELLTLLMPAHFVRAQSFRLRLSMVGFSPFTFPEVTLQKMVCVWTETTEAAM